MAERIDELQLGIGSDATKAIEQLSRLSEALSGTADQAQRLASHSAGVNSFVSSIKNLSGTKWKPIINNLTKLSQIDLSNLENKSIDLGLSTNGDSQAVTNLTNVTKAMDKLSRTRKVNLSIGDSPLRAGLTAGLNSLSRSMSGLFRTSLQLGGQGASALGNFMGKLGLIPRHTTNVNNMALSFGNLLRAVLPFVGLRGVFGWLKESVDLGSSIVEIQNVIDTAFGSLRKGYEDISGYIYKWSKSTIDVFGVSEIAALRYAGRLQSIFNSSGFDVTEGMRDSAAKMTTDLIERAGDIASFYDINVDEAMTKIISGLAGMSRPLRSLGVNMSVANLQAFALSKGIETSWKEMDQATQMALRYQYILNGTQYAENDFQRTSLSLANQLRLLSLNFQVLSSTIGQGLVSAIAPAISWLNALIRRLIQAANAFRVFMWTLFGKPLAAARGYADDLTGSIEDSSDAIGDLGGGASGASDGLGKAGKAAKELKKQLTVLPFDELNQLAKDTNSAGSGGSGGGGGGGGVGGLGGLDTSGLLPDFTADLDNSPVLDAINKWAKRIRKAFIQRDWQGLGKNIAYALNAGFAKIYDLLDWNKWKDKVYGFIQPFQASVNSMMEYIDWGLVGRTLARGLNDIVYTFRMWINGFNWRQWGKRLAHGANAMIDEWDADALGRAIADKFRAAWNFFGGWVANFDFSLFGTRLKEMIVGALDELNFSDMGESVGRFITGIAESISSALKDGDIRKKATEALTDFVNGFLKGFNGEDVREALKLLADTIGGVLGDTIKGINKDELAADFKSVLEGLPWDTIFKGLGAIVGGKLAVSLIGTAFKNRAKALLEATLPGLIGSSGTAGATAGATTGASTTGAITLGTITAATLGVTAITLGGIALGKWLDKKLRTLFPSYGKAADAQKNAKESGATGSSTSYSDVWKNFGKYTPGGGTNASGGSAPTASVPKDTKTANTVTTVMKAISDSSFKEAQKGVEFLGKNPSFTKTMYGKDGGDFKQFVFWMMDTKPYRQNKLMSASDNGNLVKYRGYMVDQGHYKAYKWVYSQDKGKFVLYRNYQTDQGHYSANKWFYGTDKGHFKDYTNILFSLPSTKTVDVKFNITTSAKKIVADVVDAAGQVAKKTVASFRMENAKGGLFTGPVGFQVFGEAGAEAAIPLERKSTMKRIASAIVDSGGMGTSNSDEIADAIAMRVLPAMAQMLDGQNQRPINVNATLYTENNEVLAKAVNRGNRSLDKRYHPVAQYSY